MASAEPRPLPGGPLAIDLLNTVWGPDGRRVDWLDDDDAVRDFVASHGSGVAALDLAATRDALIGARSLIVRLFSAESSGARHDETVEIVEIVEDVNKALSLATTSCVASDDGLRLATSSADPVAAVAVEAVVNAIGLIGDRPDRIRSCDHDDCTLWFHDTSKAGRRRWCSMELCGNRAKAQRHYNRSKAEPPVA